MRPSRIAVALCVLGVILPWAMARQDAAPMFSEWLHAQKAGPSTLVKTLGHVEEGYIKNLCLQETSQYNCRRLGCNGIQHTDSGRCPGPGEAAHSLNCGDCTTGTFYQSELTCCSDEHPHGYGSGDGDSSGGGFGSAVGSPTLKVGVCDWDVSLYQDGDTDLGTRRKRLWPPSSTAGVRKIGTAWATCFLTTAAEGCSDLLCDKMVMSFKGGAYEVAAKSTLPQDLKTAFPDLSCLDPDTFAPGFPAADGRRRQSNTTTPTTTEGTAIIFSGMVILTSLDRQVEYSGGHMDYVAGFRPRGTDMDSDDNIDAEDGSVNDTRRRRQPADQSDMVAPSPSNLLTVTPNTYTLRLIRSSRPYASSSMRH